MPPESRGITWFPWHGQKFTGFQSPEQEANFYEARKDYIFGQSHLPICGARSRNGGQCRNPSLQGHARCLQHAGPKASNERHERLKEAFFDGKLSWSAWQAHEARRARNRLRWAWKRNPWHHGQTLDLGPLEDSLAGVLRARGHNPLALPPAVLDWLRWRYRRLQVDRNADQKWFETLALTLPERLRHAGAMPPGWEPDLSGTGAVPGLERIGGVMTAKPSSKRTILDKPKAPAEGRRKKISLGRKRLRPVPNDELAFVQKVAMENRVALASLYEKCSGQHERAAVLAALVALAREPDNPALQKAWRKVAMTLARR